MTVFPTTYISPEEARLGEGLRCLHDPRFFWPPEPEPLPLSLLAEIEMALAMRETINKQRRNTGKADYPPAWAIFSQDGEEEELDIIRYQDGALLLYK